jgi:uncharacterized membrane protein
MNAFLASGLPYEIVGLVYFLFYLWMARPRAVGRYTRRSRALVLVAAIALVGAVPLHYGDQPAGVAVMLLLLLVSLVSSFVDARSSGSMR